MKLKTIQNIGSRGVLFTFEFGDSVYLINCKDKLILCDTGEGEPSMVHVKQYITDHHLQNKELFIFNSHSDWDHIWGNEAFEKAHIIGHIKCRERMMERAELDLVILSNFHDGNITIKYPDITFTDRLSFIEDGIEFIYAPGHTICSSICVDHVDEVVYVGDLIEEPIPILNHLILDDYVKSLELIKDLHSKFIITTHSHIVSLDTLVENIQYVNEVKDGRYLTFTNEVAPIIHKQNGNLLLMLKYDELVKSKMGESFNYETYKIQLWNFISNKHHYETKRMFDLRELSIDELENTLKEFIEWKKI